MNAKRILSIFVIALLANGLTVAEGVTQSKIEKVQRLSQWFEDQRLGPDAYPLGMMWITSEELARQGFELEAMRKELSNLLAHNKISDKEAVALSDLLNNLIPTGRVLTSAAEPRWLEAQPKKNPLLAPGDIVSLPSRPNALRVLTATGTACDLLHKEGLYATDYAHACFQNAGAWGWLVQPDGRVQKVGLARWNVQLQNQPAPGSWIWLPVANGLSDEFNNRMANWLSYQGVANNIKLEKFEAFHRQVTPDIEGLGAFDFAGRAVLARATANNWGNVGLLQTPSARMRNEGYFGLGLHRVRPYEQVNLMFQPMPWIETGFRYTSVLNRLYSNMPAYSGFQAYKDKSIDMKVRILKEDNWVPELALGLRDIGGTGLFSSEYLVANKRSGSLDFSLGLGWGHLGGSGNVSNPLSKLFGQSFNRREIDLGQGGKFASKSWFRGPTAIFGGLSYQSPWNVIFKVEYDGNNYKNEPLSNTFEVKHPINFGVVFIGWKGIDMHAGIERGNTLSVGVTMSTDLSGLNVSKVTDPPLPIFNPPTSTKASDWQVTAKDIEKYTQWKVDQIYLSDNKLVVEAARSNNPYPSVRLDRAMALIHQDAPTNIETVEVNHKVFDSVVAVEKVERAKWLEAKIQPPRTNKTEATRQPEYIPSPITGNPTLDKSSTHIYFDPGLDLIQTLGGPDGFVMYQFSLAMRLGLKLPAGLEVKSLVRQRLVNNYDRFKDVGSSSLPRVRTHLREYFVTAPITLTNLTINKSVRTNENMYWTVYGGYFEEMFGGIGAETLYRQPGSRWAVGLDMNKVKQRDFAQDFGFRDYQVLTGHLTGYWMTPIEGVSTSLAIGQYLAGDKGATLTVSKTFANGSVMGAYATKTNVPAEVFGEGSFDKGVFWSIPFDAFLTSSSRSNAGFSWKPLTRDGGAKLIRPVNLFHETVWLNPEVNRFKPAHPGNDRVAPDDRLER